MKYLKTYESSGAFNTHSTTKIKFPIQSYWMIYGRPGDTLNNAVSILKQILKESKEDPYSGGEPYSFYKLIKSVIEGLERDLWLNRRRSAIGVCIIYSVSNILFGTFDNDKEKKDIMYRYRGFNFGGEIKRDIYGFGNIIIDKLEPAIKNYNL